MHMHTPGIYSEIEGPQGHQIKNFRIKFISRIK